MELSGRAKNSETAEGEGFGREKSKHYQSAAHPDKTAALYLDAPVLDIRSWPGGKGKGSASCGKQALEIYALTEDTAKDFKGNPLNHAEALAKTRIPIVAVVGDADITPLSIKDPKPIVDFLLKHVRP